LSGGAQRRPQRVMGLQQQGTVPLGLGHDEQLLGQLQRLAIAADLVLDEPQSPERGKDPCGVAEPRGQLVRALDGCLDLWRSGPLDHDERVGASDQDVDGHAEHVRCLPELAEHGQRLLEERDRLAMGGARHRAVAGPVQILDRLVAQPGAPRVVGELLDVLVEAIGMEALDRADQGRVQRAAAISMAKGTSLPTTAAAWRSRLSSAPSRSIRAARIACTVGGMLIVSSGLISRYAPPLPASAPTSTSVRTLSSRKSGLPSVRAISSGFSGRTLASAPSNEASSSSALSAGSASIRSCR